MTAAAHVSTALAERPEPDTRELLLKLNDKVDQLSMQVGHLYQRTLALEELKDELVMVARDAMGALTVELSAIEHEFNADEIVHLLRKAVRSTPRFIRLLERLEAMDGLVAELEPLSKEVVRDMVERLQTWEERGYFRLAQGGVELIDRVAQHSTQEDVDRLVEHVVTIVDTVKRMTQPEMLALANNALGEIGPGAAAPQPVGVFGLVRALRDPEIRQGLGVLMQMLRHVGRAESNKPSIVQAAPGTGAKE